MKHFELVNVHTAFKSPSQRFTAAPQGFTAISQTSEVLVKRNICVVILTCQ